MEAARTGDKTAAVCRSDDQFFLHDYAVTRGMEVRLEHKKVWSDKNFTETVTITVPELNVWYLEPFDAHLHRICESLRSE
jgi:hypothetical protein